MKRLLNSSSLLIGLILVFIGVLGNRQTINNGLEKALSRVFSKNSYAQQWQIKPGSIYDGDTLRVVRGDDELKIRFCRIRIPSTYMASTHHRKSSRWVLNLAITCDRVFGRNGELLY